MAKRLNPFEIQMALNFASRPECQRTPASYTEPNIAQPPNRAKSNGRNLKSRSAGLQILCAVIFDFLETYFGKNPLSELGRKWFSRHLDMGSWTEPDEAQ